MADERLLRQMQRSLDGELSVQETEEMFSVLERDEEAAEQYDKLQRVDSLLNAVTQERAPERLAVTIMARLAQSLQAEAEAEEMPESMQQMLMLSLTLVMLVMMPMMVTASWLVLNGLRSPKLLNIVFYRMVALLVMVMRSLEMLLEEAERLAHEDPEAATIAMNLIPLVLLGMLDYLEDDDDIDFNMGG
jgi:small-conductance mechanosensitive channel